MRQQFLRWWNASAIALALAVPTAALAVDPQVEELRRTVESLRRQLEQVQQRLETQEREAASRRELDQVKADVREVADAAGRRADAGSVVHLAGYGAAGYADNDSADGRFSQVLFAPIFHYQYRDLMLLESELEIEVDEAGETETTLEYLSLDLFLHDYMALVAGKFLSPVGQFRQNLHPSWINKLPTVPPGFGHDGAAPVSDIGLQARGGFPLGGMRANYALYVANGPELNAEAEDGETELEGIEAEGATRDPDGNKVIGGRFGLLPRPHLEVGLSAATGKVAVTRLEAGEGITDVDSDAARDYDVIGADFAWQFRNRLDLRGEYVRSRVRSEPSSIAPGGATWRSWYAQAAYVVLPPHLEGALRYTDFDSPHAGQDQRQWALGVNYLFASNVIAKLAYEFNDGRRGAAADEDSLLVQFAYGF